MYVDNTENQIIISVPKEGAYEKHLIMSCNVAYPDDDSLNFQWDLITWLNDNVSNWRFIESDKNLIFIFNNQEDATLFKLTYT